MSEIRYAKDWKIAKLQFNRAKVHTISEENSFPTKRKRDEKCHAIVGNVSRQVG
jgi:hypothetical protein